MEKTAVYQRLIKKIHDGFSKSALLGHKRPTSLGCSDYHLNSDNYPTLGGNTEHNLRKQNLKHRNEYLAGFKIQAKFYEKRRVWQTAEMRQTGGNSQYCICENKKISTPCKTRFHAG